MLNKRITTSILIAVILTGFFHVHAVSADKETEGVEQVIISKKKDVTGDGIIDQITIKGIPHDKKGGFLKEITLEVKDGMKDMTFPLEGGFDPKISFADFTNDGVKDVFVQVETGGSGAIVDSNIFSFKDGMAKDLGVPGPVPVVAQFLDGYKASITPNGKNPCLLDLSGRREEYERLGIYSDGKLNEPYELMVDNYSGLKIVSIPPNRQGLKGIQRVSGAYHADALADMISVWQWGENSWVLKSTKIKSVNPKEMMDSCT